MAAPLLRAELSGFGDSPLPRPSTSSTERPTIPYAVDVGLLSHSAWVHQMFLGWTLIATHLNMFRVKWEEKGPTAGLSRLCPSPHIPVQWSQTSRIGISCNLLKNVDFCANSWLEQRSLTFRTSSHQSIVPVGPGAGLTPSQGTYRNQPMRA